MLVSGCELYNLAEKGKFAIGSFNFCTLTGLEAVVRAAEESRSPAFLSLAEVHFDAMTPELAFEIARYYASRSSVPLALHLDHGLSVETAIRSTRAGFTSVMFDGSSLPFEQNIQETIFARRLTKNLGICLEAELGELGAKEGEGGRRDEGTAEGNTGSSNTGSSNTGSAKTGSSNTGSAKTGNSDTDNSQPDKNTPHENGFTDPAMALQFVKETDVDSLAVAIGNAHGNYKGTPRLDFERLKTISHQTGRAIVLHGGTGLSTRDFQKAIELGVRKINFFTGVTFAAWKAVQKNIEQFDNQGDPWNDINKTAGQAMMETTRRQMEIFGSTGSV